MTTVRATHGFGEYRIIASGHAGDIAVCNFATGVLYAFAEYVLNAELDGFAKVKAFKANKETGHFIISCIGDERVEAAFESALYGLLALHDSNPNHIKVLVKEGR